MKIAAIKPAKAKAETLLPRTLAVDIGGSGIKTIVLDPYGAPITERNRIATPPRATPDQVLGVIAKLAAAQGPFERVSAGFPGVIKNGATFTATNLGKGWIGFQLAKAVSESLGRPARVANDADIQGLGVISGHGVELVITLGTGLGSVLFVDGHRIHIELSHHPFRKGLSYEDELGKRALKSGGGKKWNKRLLEAITLLKQTFIYDRFYIGGGNTKFITIKLPPEVTIVSNESGLLGGIKLWEDSSGADSQSNRAAPTAVLDAPGSSAENPPVD
ncbi:MAG TPA: ROK family protein [Candidatus Binataceae bacterium]|nr:ROK family protein [Candidatus Binataceae bacterium]